MIKTEIARYLVHLHTLLSAQDQAGGVNRSQMLAEEYNKHWDLLKNAIAKDNDDESRKS